MGKAKIVMGKAKIVIRCEHHNGEEFDGHMSYEVDATLPLKKLKVRLRAVRGVAASVGCCLPLGHDGKHRSVFGIGGREWFGESGVCCEAHPTHGSLCQRPKGHAGSHISPDTEGSKSSTWSYVA